MGLWKFLRTAPLLKQGQQEQVTQDHVQLGFKYLQGQRPKGDRGREDER